MKYLKRLGIAFVVVLVLLLAIAYLLPGSSHVERSIVVERPRCNVFALVDGFGWFNDFSPWAQLDPDTRYSFEGPTRGVGAALSWESEHANVGSGRQETVLSTPCERVEQALDFGQQGTAISFFTFEQEGPRTEVTWGFDSEHGLNPIARYLGLMLDDWIGPEYEQGLASLKALSENLPVTSIEGLEPQLVELEPRPIAAMSTRSAKDAEAMGTALEGAYEQITLWMQGAGLQPAGAPIAITLADDGETWVFQAAIPYQGSVPAEASGPVVLKQTAGGKALRVEHVGPYAELDLTRKRLDAWLRLYRTEAQGSPWEEYVSDPATTPEAELTTRLYVPL